jgi:hypothetical protein
VASADVVRDMGRTLLYLLRAGIPSSMVEPGNIKLATPDEFEQNPAKPHITLFLYRVTICNEVRNSPHRTLADGRVTRPLLPLELRYLITPWASDTADEHRILGRIIQVLYDKAELGSADLQDTSWSKDDSVQLIFESLPPEDHYRIWDTTEIPYRLSLTYMCRVIGIEPTEKIGYPPVVEARLGTGAA